jgi:hypothetical protein
MDKTKQWLEMCNVDHNTLDEKIANWEKKLKIAQ